MASLLAFAVLLCISIFNVASADPLLLTTSNFDSTLTIDESSPSSLVFFFAPWCSHCKKFQPEFDELSDILSKKGHIVAKVDAVAQTALATKYNVSLD